MRLGESRTFKFTANTVSEQIMSHAPFKQDIVVSIKLLDLQFTRTDILNYLIKTYNCKSYLEIGIEHPENNFDYIQIDNKIGVDPAPKGKCDYIMTSDMYFESYCNNNKFDLIFIDGLHLEEQVTKDFNNSLMHLNEGGIIVLHDCNPLDESRQSEQQAAKNCAWNGTCWKSFVELRMTRPDLQMHCVDCDEGCGIVKKGEQEIYTETTLKQAKHYSYLESHRKKLLNLITFEQFKKFYQCS
jgi:hypothetical protein